MKRQAFQKNNEPAWVELEAAAEEMEKGKLLLDAEAVPRLFSRVCADLSLAQHRMYGRKLCERLNELVIKIYGHMNRAVNRSGLGAARFVAVTFPCALRREARLFWLNMALFFVPMFAFIAAAYFEPSWIFSIVTPELQRQMDGMYGPGTTSDFLREEHGSDVMMWAFYINNNVSIGFRIFAGGVLCTLGAIFFTAYNGILIGAMTGYIHFAGHTDNFYRFVVGHSSLELVGLVICGVAGMRLGLALLNPGRLPRRDALREAGRRALPVLYGGAFMIFLAAFVEGFWSASAAPPAAKYIVGITLWVLLAGYLLFAGRGADET